MNHTYLYVNNKWEEEDASILEIFIYLFEHIDIVNLLNMIGIETGRIDGNLERIMCDYVRSNLFNNI